MQSEGRLAWARRKLGKEGGDLPVGALRGHGPAGYRPGWRKSCLLRKPPAEQGHLLPEPWVPGVQALKSRLRSERSQGAGIILITHHSPHLVNEGEVELGPRCRIGIYPIHPRFPTPIPPESSLSSPSLSLPQPLNFVS